MAVEFLVVFIPMFVEIDPFGTLPFYLALTSSMDKPSRNKTLMYAVVFAAALLLVFAIAGKAILEYLSVSIDALRITGGILLIIIGVSMLYEGDMPRSKRQGAEDAEDKIHTPEDVAFVPLGTPFLAGPGAISVVIISAGTANVGMTVLALLAVMALSALLLWRSDIVYKVVGNAGTRALTRVMGLITSAYAVQMVLDGIAGYVSSL